MSKYNEQNQQLKRTFIDWISGLIGGFMSVTICAPLDVAKTRMALIATINNKEPLYTGFIQTLQRIYKDEGIKGLYKGYRVTAISIPFFHSVYFALYYHVKHNVVTDRLVDSKNSYLIHLISAVATGLVTDTITNPFWVLRTRIQSQYLHNPNEEKYIGIIQGMKQIYKEEGFLALYKGLGVSYLGLSHVAVLFPIYEYMKESTRRKKQKELSNLDIIISSVVAKLVAITITYPHVVIRARIQDCREPRFVASTNIGGSTATIGKRIGILSVVKNIFNKEGILGFYSGMKFDIARVVPANTITFWTFEFVKYELEKFFDISANKRIQYRTI